MLFPLLFCLAIDHHIFLAEILFPMGKDGTRATAAKSSRHDDPGHRSERTQDRLQESRASANYKKCTGKPRSVPREPRKMEKTKYRPLGSSSVEHDRKRLRPASPRRPGAPPRLRLRPRLVPPRALWPECCKGPRLRHGARRSRHPAALWENLRTWPRRRRGLACDGRSHVLISTGTMLGWKLVRIFQSQGRVEEDWERAEAVGSGFGPRPLG